LKEKRTLAISCQSTASGIARCIAASASPSGLLRAISGSCGSSTLELTASAEDPLSDPTQSANRRSTGHRPQEVARVVECEHGKRGVPAGTALGVDSQLVEGTRIDTLYLSRVDAVEDDLEAEILYDRLLAHETRESQRGGEGWEAVRKRESRSLWSTGTR
jgi:hypothetical protein